MYTIKQTSRILSLLALLLIALHLAGTTAANAATRPCKTKVTFAGYDPQGSGEVLTNFPALVILNTNIVNFFYDQFMAPANGGDLRFVNSNETMELSYEIEQWNTNGSSYVWVQVPEIYGTNTCVWACWGNPAEANPPPCTTNGTTWSNGYAAVWHLAENTNDIRFDSTSYNNDAPASLILGTPPAAAPGRIGICNSFNGANALGVSNSVSLSDAVTNGLEISMWLRSQVELTASGASNRVLEKDNCYFMLQGLGTGGMNLLIKCNGTNYTAANGTTMNSNQWYFVTGMFDGITARIYLDGILKGSTSVNAPIGSSAGILRIGSDGPSPSQYFTGDVDELRISSIPRSSNWVWACWMNEGSNAAFNSYGTVTIKRLPVTDNGTGASNVTFTSATLRGTLLSTGASPTEVWVYWGNDDGGTNATGWANTNYFGINMAAIPVPYSTNVAGLSSNTFFYYRYCAANASGTNWADSTATFVTAEVRLQASDGSASEAGADPGTFIVSRNASATNGTLMVKYTITGSASSGVDYVFLENYVIIPAGATNANITLTPIDDDVWNEGAESVTLTIAQGGYITGSPNTAAVTIKDNETIASWQNKMKITFTGYLQPDVLTNFPALVILGTNITGFSYDEFAAPLNGGDLRFANSNETVKVNYEIEKWDPGGDSYIWVQVPELSGTNTSIWAYWGNPNATNPPAYTTNGATWSDGYEAVWHLRETPSETVHDSTMNHHDGVTTNMDSGNQLPGQIDGSLDYNGLDEYIVLQNALTLASNNEFSISAWVRPASDLPAYAGVLCQTGGDADSLRIYTDNRPNFRINGNNCTFASTIATNGTTWSHIALSRAVAGTIKQYTNGGDDTGAAWSQTADFEIKYLARGKNDDTRDWKGRLDEIRVSNVVRSPLWFWTCYMNQSAPASFNTYGKISRYFGTVITVR